ncbi:MAG: hypothetical protein K6G04_00565 [Lachnospiraceae bacterium]|nr:hypothetical protein [Lachnospiraceae bacterium]
MVKKENSTNTKKTEILIKTALTLGLILALLIAFKAGMSFGAGAGEPGTQADPIVTLSYLESRLANMDNTGEGGYTSQTGSGKNGGMTKITLSKGDVLNLDQGTLLVIYSGSGIVAGSSGLVNISSGELFKDGMTAVLYSLYMGLAGDSAVLAKGEMTVYISGGYSLD